MTLTPTALAQRRLLEAIAALSATAGGIQQLQLGMQPAIKLADSISPPVAAIYRAIYDLAGAVAVDLSEEENHHA